MDKLLHSQLSKIKIKKMNMINMMVICDIQYD